MRVAIVNNCVPFITGEAEYLADALRRKFIEYGHEAINVNIPFQWHPPDAIIESMLAARLLSLPDTDLMVGLKFPACYLPHQNKVLWLLPQFRQPYDLWGTPFPDLPAGPDGERIRDAVIAANNAYLPEARLIYTASEVAGERLRNLNFISSEVLYPPLLRSDHLRHASYGDYVFYLSRITRGKRQHLLVDAARLLRSKTRVVIAGQPETPDDCELLRRKIEEYGIGDRVTVIPEFISEEDKARHFANALACVYMPWDEDSYGYVMLEACQCRKPVITCTDSSGTSHLIVDRVTGRLVEPDAHRIAEAIDELAGNHDLASDWGNAAFDRMMQLGIHWDNVIRKLTA